MGDGSERARFDDGQSRCTTPQYLREEHNKHHNQTKQQPPPKNTRDRRFGRAGWGVSEEKGKNPEKEFVEKSISMYVSIYTNPN
mmetsp:Transcript_544/g.1169  ORF Transcript_544/g.1169 Transcript_544/m.1169 type:complete len:84 (+) Transcript_544:769-1020(+)